MQAGSGWSNVAERFLDLAKANPFFWVGAAFVALAFIQSAGTSGIDTRSPHGLLLGPGLVLLAGGSAQMLRTARRQVKDRFSDAVCYDAAFWHEVFDVLPPTFIKTCTEDSTHSEDSIHRLERADHIAENRPFEVAENPHRPGNVTDEMRQVIKADHVEGDRLAFAHQSSRMIESHDTYGLNPVRQILTSKKRIDYGGRKFIVGWYVPLELPDNGLAGDKHEVRELGGQIVYGLVAPRDDEESVTIHVGKSSLKAATKPK
jgi:hypothetical protein